MALELRAGMRLRSVACTTEVIVVKAVGSVTDLRCGGHAMVAAGGDEEARSLVAGADGGTRTGKRYVDGDRTLEVLCTKPGAGSLSVGDALLQAKDAKPLPASD